MKLLRFGRIGEEKPGLIDTDGYIRDLSGYVDDIAGNFLSDNKLSKLSAIDTDTLPLIPDHVRLGSCVGSVGKLIGIGLNYTDHALEAGMDIPTEPVVFLKASSSICGPNDPTPIPRNCNKLDWEAELAIVIGKEAKYIPSDKALEYVAGYCIANDVSERSLQLEHSGQWTKGKSSDYFGPIGPWLVTKEEIKDPHNLNIWLTVNSEIMQKGSTCTMIFDVEELVSYLSGIMTLYPGDIISTGTPPGIGLTRKPPRFLQPGDIVELGIDGLGVQRQEIVSD